LLVGGGEGMAGTEGVYAALAARYTAW